jgi:hypothetical protein
MLINKKKITMVHTEFAKSSFSILHMQFFKIKIKNFCFSIREAFQKVVNKPSDSKTTVSSDSFRIRQNVKGTFLA